MTDHKAHAVLAAVAWKRLNAKTSEYNAAVMMDDQAEAERIRGEAHDLLDAHMDQQGAVARATLAIIGK